MANEGTDNTADNATNTADAGQGAASAGTGNQDAEVTRLRDLETKIAKFAELESKNQSLEQQLRTQQAEALRWSTSYRSLQASTTSSLQEAARQRQQAAEQARVIQELTASRQEIAQMRDGISFLASKMGDEDTAREFAIRQRETQARLAEEQARARIAQLQQAANVQNPTYQEQQTQPPFVDPDAQKRQFVEYYFPNRGIDHNDSRLDWGEGAPSTQEAFRRFTTSVTNILEDRQRNQGQQSTPSEAQALLDSIRKEREELEKARANVSTEVSELARREVEERLRRTGADAGNAGGRDEGVRRAATRLNEVDESKLMVGEPGARKAAAKNMEEELRSVRNQLISQYQR